MRRNSVHHQKVCSVIEIYQCCYFKVLLFLIVGSVAVLNRQTPAEHEEGN